MLIFWFIEEMGVDWKVFGFDIFDGFLFKWNVFDMYVYFDCVFFDVDLVKVVFMGWNVEVIEGDVVQMVLWFQDQDLVLFFVDIDNFLFVSVIICVIVDCMVIGGMVVFDYWIGYD